MAERKKKANPESLKTGPGKGPDENQETGPDESQDGESGGGQGPEKPKALTATRPVLYLSKQYKAGEKLPLNNQEMVVAWLEAGSAAWQEPGAKQFP